MIKCDIGIICHLEGYLWKERHVQYTWLILIPLERREYIYESRVCAYIYVARNCRIYYLNILFFYASQDRPFRDYPATPNSSSKEDPLNHCKK